MWQNLENHMNTFTINGTILTKGHQHSILKIFNSIWLLRFCKDPPPPQQPTKISWKIVAFFFYQVFFHRHWRLTGQQGKRGDHFLFHSTLPLPPTYRHSDIYLQLCTVAFSSNPLHQKPFLFFHHDFHHLHLDVLILGILLCSVWKSTCKVQNTYDGEPFNVILNQWNIFFRIREQMFCFDYIYNNLLFVWSWMWQERCMWC